MHLERTEVREDHSRSVCVGSLALRLSRLLRRRVESPLQEVDIRARAKRVAVGVDFFGTDVVGLLAREGEDELRVVTRGVGNALVDV